MAETMKTWRYDAVVGKLEDCLVREDAVKGPDRNSLSPDQLVVEVITAALNPVDYKLPESGRMGKIMIKRPATPGLDYCGRVVARHPSNTSVAIGQLVFGGLPHGGPFGTTGQFILVNMSECASLPDGITPDEAAAVGTAATTAYQSILPHVKEGWKVFINGGSGGVGTWTIQIAKVRGAVVTVSCSTGNIALCQRLGADHIIDYTKGDLITSLKENGEIFDAVIDNVGSPQLYDKRDLYLRSGGWFVQVGTGPLSFGSVSTIMTRHLWPTVLNRRGTHYYFVQQKNSREFLEQIAKWMVEGRARPVIDERFEWQDVPAALARVRQGRAKGKVLVLVSSTEG